MKEFFIGITYIMALSLLYPYLRELDDVQHQMGTMFFALLASPLVFFFMEKMNKDDLIEK